MSRQTLQKREGIDPILSEAQIEELMTDLRTVMEWRFGSVTIEVVYGKVKRIQVMISKDIREGSG